MHSYGYQSIEEEQIQQYKQQIGLKKMLFKYQNENQQLKAQIKALTQRLQTIMSSKTEKNILRNGSPNPRLIEGQQKYLKDQMNYYFKRTEQLNGEIKKYKQVIDQSKQQQCTKLSDVLKQKISKLQALQSKLEKYKLQQSNGTANNNGNVNGLLNNKSLFTTQFQNKIMGQLEQLKKKVRQLQKTKHSNHKQDINRHSQMVDLQTKTRKIINGDADFQTLNDAKDSTLKKGIWGMDLTPQNFKKMSEDFQQLKREKNNLLESMKVQNQNLREKLTKLKNQYLDISASSKVNQSLDLSTFQQKKQIQNYQTPKKQNKQTIVLPEIPASLGLSAYQRKNDKNFVAKKPHLIQWTKNKGGRTTGFSWNDQNLKSPITGINIWFDKILIGIQFIHTLGQTIQHLHIETGEIKKLIPINYRLNSNDYVENIILVISKKRENQQINNLIVGIQIYSKNGRKDVYGVKQGTQDTQKFDFAIKASEKPIYSFGSFTIDGNTHLSCINSLGFAII